MFFGLSYKNSFYLLLAGIVFLCFLIYGIAIVPTVQLKNEISKLDKRLLTAREAPGKIESLESKIESFNRVLTGSASGSAALHEKLHGVISRYCRQHNVILRSFPAAHKFQQGNYVVETNIIVVQGTFIKLLRLLFHLETEENFGKISSVLFSSYFNRKQNSTFLTMTIYVQNIKQDKNESNVF